MKAGKILPEASRKAMELEGQAGKMRARAAALKDQALLEDLTGSFSELLESDHRAVIAAERVCQTNNLK